MSNAAAVSSITDAPATPKPRFGVIDLAGLPVDCSGPVWPLNEATKTLKLDWLRISIASPAILEASADYIVALIRTRSPSHVRNAFVMLVRASKLKIFENQCLANHHDPRSTLTAEVFHVARDHEKWPKLHLVHFRAWFSWCSTRCAAFDAQGAVELRNVRIKGAPPAMAVRSRDPDKGPLDDVDTMLLLNALRAALERNTLPPASLGAVWLCVLFGLNPRQLALLREVDLVVRDEGLAELRVPRMKKRHSDVRMGFRARKLDARALSVLQRVMAANQWRREWLGWLDPDFALPMFPRDLPRAGVAGGPRHAYAMHPTDDEISAIVTSTVEALDVRSTKTGQPLRMTPRRFRYLFATRLFREGASERAVADLLDHVDLQTVQNYVNLKGDIVEKLDDATAIDLAPFAQAFMGKLVTSERAAVRGDESASRISHRERGSADLKGVGTCGNFAFCGLAAPRACYVCVHFQPWIDAPHELVLRSLTAEREQAEAAGLGARMVELNDDLILAVADVVDRCVQIRSGRQVPIGCSA